MAVSTGGWVDELETSIQIQNESGLAIENDPQIREIASQLNGWAQAQKARTSQAAILSRDKFATPTTPYEEFRAARSAVDTDDIVSGAFDVIEGLTLQQVGWESANVDAADIMNQISATVNLDDFARVMLRERLTYGQSVVAARWSMQTFQMTKPIPGADGKAPAKNARPRQKAFTLYAPHELTTLDPRRCVPVGSTVFGRDRLAWNAVPEETEMWEYQMRSLIPDDPIMLELFYDRYVPSQREEVMLAEWGVAARNLIELNPATVWRHTATRPRYEPFAPMPLRSLFQPLDLKQQLMESDRVNLVGSANYIMLVRKGSKEEPASNGELTNLRENFKRVAKIPIIVGDHRLQIDIIVPDLKYTLDSKRYATLDAKILNRLLGTLDGGSDGNGDVDAQVRTRMIQRKLENVRRMLRRDLESHLRDAVWKHPLNASALAEFKADDKPSLAYTPRNVQIDNDSQITAGVVALRDKRELSRESTLEFFGFDQAVEAARRQHEELHYDDIFKTAVPFSGQGAMGGDDKGGRPVGGGEPSKSTVRPSTSNGSSKKE